MKKILILGMILCSAVAQAGIPFPYPVQTKTLPNGLKVIHVQKADVPMVEVQVWYRVGSKDETAGIRGMAHLFEHMMFRGSKNFRGEGDVFIHEIEKMGGSVNAYTTFDRTVYHEQIPKQFFSKVMQMEADRMENLVLDQKTLDVEREVVGEELRNGRNNWMNRMMSDRHPKLYPNGHPYAVDVIGYLDEILKFSTAQCEDFYRKYYSPNNAFLVVVGDVTADEVMKMAAETFGKITRQKPATPAPTLTSLPVPDLYNDDMKVDLPIQIYSFVANAPGVNSPDYAAWKVAGDLLFNSPRSRVSKELVEDSKVAFGVIMQENGGEIYPSRITIDLYMRAGPGNVKAKKLMNHEIADMAENGPEEQELNDYRNYLKAQLLQSAYTISQISGIVGMAEFTKQDPLAWDYLYQSAMQVTPTQVQEAVKKYFMPEKLGFLNIKPEDQ